MRKLLAALLALSIYLAAPCAAIKAESVQKADGTLRVWLQSLGAVKALGLTLDGAYTVEGDRGFRFEKGTEIKLGADGGSIVLEVGGAAIDMGGGFTLTRHLDEDGNAGGAYIHESEKDTLYCGDLTFSLRTDGCIRVIVKMQIEDYLYGVVPYEMSDTFPLEALKAQAVTARTYAMQRAQRRAGQDYDVCDTTDDQVFKGLDTRFELPIQAVDETRGLVGMYKGGYAECFYSASNGGQTALATDVWGAGDYDYLDMRDDPYDLENPESLVRTAVIPFDARRMNSEIYSLLTQKAGEQLYQSGELLPGEAVGLFDVENVEAVEPIYGGQSRQYGVIRFTVRAGVRRYDGPSTAGVQQLGEVEMLQEPLTLELDFYDQVRAPLGLALNAGRSDMVTVEKGEEGFTLTSRRYGHGVGMSQRGAQRMAGVYGMTCEEILAFYYPGIEWVTLEWQEPELTAVDALPESLGYAAPRPTPAPTPAPLPALSQGEYYAAVNVAGVDSTLNVRREPSTQAEILGVLRNGQRLIVIEEAADGWVKMKTGELEGYVMTNFIVKE